MSFDPFHEQQPQRDPAPRPALDSASANAPVGGAAPPVTPAKERVLVPSILLIVVGVLNLIYAGYFVASIVVQLSQTLEQKKAMAEAQQAFFVKLFPDMKKEFEAREKAGLSIEEEMRKAMPMAIGTAALTLLGALLPLLAGIRMLKLRNYGLVFFGSIVAAIPCISGSSCCCVGEVAGIYAVILLLQTDIRDAFR